MRKNRFISNDFAAITIIKIKQFLFGIDYITTGEFEYIRNELQKTFNKEDNGMIIHSDFNKFDPDNIEANNSIITITEEASIIFGPNHRLANYFYVIAELIMEYAEKELETKKLEFERFKNENDTFEKKQISLLKRLSN